MTVDLQLGYDPPRPRPSLGLVILAHFKALYLRFAMLIAGVVGFEIAQGRRGAALEHLVAAITKHIQQPFRLAKLVHLRYRHPGVAPDQDQHLRPGGPQRLDDATQRRHRPTTGVYGSRPQPGRQRKARFPIEDEEREILVLIEVAVKETQHLLSMG